MKILLILIGLLAISVISYSAEVPVYAISEEGVGKQIGSIQITDSKYGLLLKPTLSGLPPGVHGFHVHEHANCAAAEKDGKMAAGHAAGSHFDTEKGRKHDGPYGNGHLGDLPVLIVDGEGRATIPVLAPRVKVADLSGKSLMIHAGGDNYDNQPDPLGGGGGRIACGPVK
ncbi:superoxide dismutase family protein [bacterium]|nr:superoxide dismutase family protein [bacterium]MCI0605357.1 superoxide dismutase family protein [bacterium]